MYAKRIEIMLSNQNILNSKTAGPEWTEGITDKGKEINWPRCIRAESCELRNSYPWEHWSKIDAKPDLVNAYVEISDLWHFIMSLCITTDTQLSFKEIAIVLNKCFVDKRLTINDDIVSLTEDLDKATYNRDDHKYIVYKFVKILDGIGMDFDSLEKLYNGKRILNGFRQDNGYKEGTYKKIWQGREDNKFMVGFIKDNPEISEAELYAKLTKTYKSLETEVD